MRQLREELRAQVRRSVGDETGTKSHPSEGGCDREAPR
jgi:hypothetical protein